MRLICNSKIENVDGYSSGQETGGVYLDHLPVGDITNTEGAWILISWERFCVVKLVGV